MTTTLKAARVTEGDPAAWIGNLLLVLGSKRLGPKFQCPAHGMTGEHQVALAVKTGTDGKALLFCHAGCSWREVLTALKLPADVLRFEPEVTPTAYAKTVLPGVDFPAPKNDRGPGSGWVAVDIAEHPYGEPRPFAWKVRERNASGAKRVHWESLNEHGERVIGLLGRAEADLPLYRPSDARLARQMGRTLVLVESESSSDALFRCGLYSTTWAGSASSPPLERLSELADVNVLLVPDFDEAGIACAEKIHTVLPNARVQLGEPGEDARDILSRRGTLWFR